MFYKMGKLVIISAPSGAGKSTIISHLLKRGVKLDFSISATTRKPRGKEQHGKEYYFLTNEEFDENIANDMFVEWEEVYANQRYGTLKTELERIWDKGYHVLFDVDVKGGINLKRKFGQDALSIFIMPPSIKELERRLIGRGTDSIDKIMMRVKKAKSEIDLADEFDYIVVNDKLEKAVDEVYSLVSDFLNEY